LKVFLSEAEEGLTPQTLWTAASLTVNKLMKGGTVRQTEVTVKSGDNLRAKTNLPEYEEFAVDEVNLNTNRVIFGNGMEIVVGGSQGADKEALFEAQIRYTIEEHFRKQRRLRDRGIKVLSLFFIDRVDNYATADGIIRRYFTSAFDELKKKYSDWQSLSADDVQASYFAFTKRKGGRIELEDSASGESKKDEAAYDLIMKDKERLLSFDTKEAFIFSHSALREGWDNPNIFQICTLHQTTSEIRKRQEVGRGVRLAVSQIGERTHDPEVNVLTVVANQSYEDYVRQLQEEIHEEYGEGVELPPKPPNARKPATVRLRKEYVLKPEFKELWDKIKGRTRYYVNIDTEQVITEAVAEVDKLQIKTPRIVISKAELKIDDEGDFEAYLSSTAKTVVDLAGRYPLPNLVEIMAYLLEHTTPPVRLSRKTLVEIFLRTKNKKAALDNPFEFASEVVRVLKEQLADHLVNGMQYEKIDDWYEMSRLEELIVPAWEGHVVPAEHSVYDNVIFDSEIERKFVEDLEKRREVKMYIKLPSWFEVDTPVGKYNPDWAIVWEWTDTHGEPNGKPLLYLVSETKGATIDKLRSDERRKVQCGEKHFQGALGTRYRLVQNASELP
jgi:type III restriction enzyme